MNTTFVQIGSDGKTLLDFPLILSGKSESEIYALAAQFLCLPEGIAYEVIQEEAYVFYGHTTSAKQLVSTNTASIPYAVMYVCRLRMLGYTKESLHG